MTHIACAFNKDITVEISLDIFACVYMAIITESASILPLPPIDMGMWSSGMIRPSGG